MPTESIEFFIMLGVLGQNKALSLNTPMNVIGLAGFV
jgi:hypothetical protein